MLSDLKDRYGGSGTESVHGSNIMDKARATGPTAITLIDGVPVNDPDPMRGTAG